MFMQPRDASGKQEEDFNKPVESIMRCEDFKSNFARRLSNRYISRSPVSSSKQDTGLKLGPLVNDADEIVSDNVPERIALGPQLSKKINTEQIGENVKPPDKNPYQNTDIRNTEVTVLNMEVDTLRWQLAQTEANRQMHIALLKQIVVFLNRVKEHIEGQNNEVGSRKGTLSTRLLPRSFNVADLPRSRSVVHVNKNAEYPISTPKRISTRKISKSISNVNGFRDCNGLNWSQSKLSLSPEMEISQKISEEMARLITLANTVLSTKLPDLANYASNEKTFDSNGIKPSDGNSHDKIDDKNDSNITLDLIEKDAVNFISLNTVENSTYLNKNTKDQLIPSQEESIKNVNGSTMLVKCGKEAGYPDASRVDKDNIIFSPTNHSINDLMSTVESKSACNKRNIIASSNFVEDESGFSSMSSFQEIGIPIISIIPPSPSKDIGFLEEIPDIINDAEKWKTDTLDLDEQSVKVFWV